MPAAIDRLDVRLTKEKKELIEQAAAASGQTVTDFTVSTLCRRARKVLREEQVLVLTDRDRDAFLAALENPPKPNAALLRAARDWRDARESGAIKG
jgi:uncharacterized protein (DUF1778 family)